MRNQNPEDAELAMITDMLVPVEQGYASAYSDGCSGYLYRCRHVLANGDCDIYEQRPRMCRDYPNQGAYRHHAGCPYSGCTWNAVNDGKIGRLYAHEMYALNARVYLNGQDVTDRYLQADDRAGYMRMPDRAELHRQPYRPDSQGVEKCMPQPVVEVAVVRETVIYGRVVIDLVQTIAGGE